MQVFEGLKKFRSEIDESVDFKIGLDTRQVQRFERWQILLMMVVDMIVFSSLVLNEGEMLR